MGGRENNLTSFALYPPDGHCAVKLLWQHECKVYGEFCMFTYVIYGVLRGSSEGLQFHSCVPDLETHPELWADECPFPVASGAPVRIELATSLTSAAVTAPRDRSVAEPPRAPSPHAARRTGARAS